MNICKTDSNSNNPAYEDLPNDKKRASILNSDSNRTAKQFEQALYNHHTPPSSKEKLLIAVRSDENKKKTYQNDLKLSSQNSNEQHLTNEKLTTKISIASTTEKPVEKACQIASGDGLTTNLNSKHTVLSDIQAVKSPHISHPHSIPSGASKRLSAEWNSHTPKSGLALPTKDVEKKFDYLMNQDESVPAKPDDSSDQTNLTSANQLIQTKKQNSPNQTEIKQEFTPSNLTSNNQVIVSHEEETQQQEKAASDQQPELTTQQIANQNLTMAATAGSNKNAATREQPSLLDGENIDTPQPTSTSSAKEKQINSDKNTTSEAHQKAPYKTKNIAAKQPTSSDSYPTIDKIGTQTPRHAPKQIDSVEKLLGSMSSNVIFNSNAKNTKQASAEKKTNICPMENQEHFSKTSLPLDNINQTQDNLFKHASDKQQPRAHEFFLPGSQSVTDNQVIDNKDNCVHDQQKNDVSTQQSAHIKPKRSFPLGNMRSDPIAHQQHLLQKEAERIIPTTGREQKKHEKDQQNPINEAVSGDVLLQRLHTAPTTEIKKTEIPATRLEQISKLVESIRVSTSHPANQADIHITMKEGVWSGTTIQLSLSGNQLKIDILTTRENADMLTAHKSALLQQLSDSCPNLRTNVSISTTSEQMSDGRSRQQYVTDQEEDEL